MLCSILGIKIRDRIRFGNINGDSGAREVGWVIKNLKLKYAGYLSREKNKWNRIAEEWSSKYLRKKQCGPLTPWRDELVEDWNPMDKDDKGQGRVEEDGESLCPHSGGFDGLTATYEYMPKLSIQDCEIKN